MKTKKIQAGEYEVHINNVPSYEIMDFSFDKGYAYWQVKSLELIDGQYCPSGIAEAFNTLKEAKQYISEQEGK